MTGRLFSLPEPLPLPAGYRLATLEEVRSLYPLPSAFRLYAALLPQLLTP